jgi:hypothetical protein
MVDERLSAIRGRVAIEAGKQIGVTQVSSWLALAGTDPPQSLPRPYAARTL